MADLQADREELFGFLESPDSRPRFWDRVADDVDWTVQGTHPLAGRYCSKDAFVPATSVRLAAVFDGAAKLELLHLAGAGETTVAEIRVTAKTHEAPPTTHALLDLPLRRRTDRRGPRLPGLGDVTWTLSRNEPQPGS